MPRPAQPTSHPLRAWRVRHEISIVMLAEAAKLSTASISRIERGQQQPRTAAIRRLIEISGGELTAGALLDLRQGDGKTRATGAQRRTAA
jgi:predicted transcriptional regulator